MPYLRTILNADSAGRLKAIVAADGVLMLPARDVLSFDAYRAAYRGRERVEVRLPAVALAELAAVLDDDDTVK